jgi:cysteine synthase A
MLPDTGERYLSTPLFENIGEEMSADEIALSRSTPNYRFDVPATCAVAPAREQSAELDAEAVQFVNEVIAAEPVVLFALEWCEFCWSVRKLFGKLGLPYRSIDLDSVAYQENDRGGKIRAALGNRIGVSTIPQIFIGGQHVGGCTELFDSVRDGTVQKRLEECGIAWNSAVDVDPYTLFPNWLQPRKSA